MQFSKNNYHEYSHTLTSLTSHQVVGTFPAISSLIKLLYINTGKLSLSSDFLIKNPLKLFN